MYVASRYCRPLYRALWGAPAHAVIIVPSRQQQRHVQRLIRHLRPYSDLRVVCPYCPQQLTWLAKRHPLIVRGLPWSDGNGEGGVDLYAPHPPPPPDPDATSTGFPSQVGNYGGPDPVREWPTPNPDDGATAQYAVEGEENAHA